MLKLISLFSGIGAFEKALSNLGVDFELVNYCEIDKYASKAYSVIHGISEDLNLGDVTKANAEELPKDIDILTYGFPCTDISQAGKQKGFIDENGNQTRSGLFFDAMRIIESVKPKYAIAENVKALTSDKFKTEFKTVLGSLSKAGYSNYYKVLNSKDFGIPQNRERIFIVSIRKDIDDGFFSFPLKQELKLRLKDMLESEVDENYYLSDKQIMDIINSFDNGIIKHDLCKDGRENLDKRSWDIVDEASIIKPERTEFAKKIRKKYENGTISAKRNELKQYAPRTDGLSNTLTTVQKDNCVFEPLICASRGRNPLNPSDKTQGIYLEQRLEINMDGLSNTLTSVQKDNYLIEPNVGHNPISKKLEFDGFHTDFCPCILATDFKAPKCSVTNDFRIRKLTPKECWRLMGFEDSDIQKCIDAGISKTQLYKMAGNSIVVNVLESLFREILGV